MSDSDIFDFDVIDVHHVLNCLPDKVNKHNIDNCEMMNFKTIQIALKSYQYNDTDKIQ